MNSTALKPSEPPRINIVETQIDRATFQHTPDAQFAGFAPVWYFGFEHRIDKYEGWVAIPASITHPKSQVDLANLTIQVSGEDQSGQPLRAFIKLNAQGKLPRPKKGHVNLHKLAEGAIQALLEHTPTGEEMAQIANIAQIPAAAA